MHTMEACNVGKRDWCQPHLLVQSIDRITKGNNGTICDNANTAGDQNTSCQNSDIRLKRDIAEVGCIPNGLKLYSFRYNWSDETYIGVMAQDVLEVMPEAVTTDDSGFYTVNYAMLGLEMVSLDLLREARGLN